MAGYRSRQRAWARERNCLAFQAEGAACRAGWHLKKVTANALIRQPVAMKHGNWITEIESVDLVAACSVARSGF